jgi:hypothetical protein
MLNRTKKEQVTEEPVGIVIARGRTTDTPPRFAAFIWGPVPEAELESASAATKAA